jgi:hypothetical protein
VVDERRVRRILQRISHDLAYRESRASGDRDGIRRDPDRLAAFHGYVDVDDDLVVAQLERVASLAAFVASVARWTESGGSE